MNHRDTTGEERIKELQGIQKKLNASTLIFGQRK